jgi:hypothetical protein
MSKKVGPKLEQAMVCAGTFGVPDWLLEGLGLADEHIGPVQSISVIASNENFMDVTVRFIPITRVGR